MAKLFGIYENMAQHEIDLYGDIDRQDYWNTELYRNYIQSKKSIMSDEDAMSYYEKTIAYLKETHNYDYIFYRENKIELDCLLNARNGYREKLKSENADNIEEKVNQMYPLEELFAYDYFSEEKNDEN